MAWFLFVDESGQDGKESPYEVLAGVAVEDRVLWKLIQTLKQIQEDHFGIRLFNAYGSEAKAQKLLKRKVYKHAAQLPEFESNERKEHARSILLDGTHCTKAGLTALAQAKLSYVEQSLQACRNAGVVAFASIIPNSLVRQSERELLRKDYVYFFERFFHFLNRQESDPMGAIIFDELDKSQSNILMNQMEQYFLKTRSGRTRSRLIIPEPLFVHSDLTTMVQMADLIAYTVSWGVRLKGMSEPVREEMANLASLVCQMRYKAETESGHTTWGFKLISNLSSTTQA